MHSLNEIGLIPTVLSDVEHRSDINPYYPSVCKEGIVRNTFGKLPIFVAPMTCIIDENNFKTFKKSKAIPIIPRGIRGNNSKLIDIQDTDWVAYSLQGFKESFCDKSIYKSNWEGKVLIDVANGHMKCIYDYVKEAKSIWGNQLTVMVGNIANPETYLECCKAGVDYVRVGIGGGSACTTGVQTGIHASMAWLLTNIANIKSLTYFIPDWDNRPCKVSFLEWIKEYNYTHTKIIADGGIDTIDKAIKCLALGADYVMMGKAFAQCDEACGETRISMINDPKPLGKSSRVERLYYGMASERGQKDISGGVKKNPEGLETWVPILYTLDEFLDKFEAALRSCMSYCGAHNLSEFVGKVKWEPMTEAEFRSYYK